MGTSSPRGVDRINRQRGGGKVFLGQLDPEMHDLATDIDGPDPPVALHRGTVTDRDAILGKIARGGSSGSGTFVIETVDD